MRSCSTCAFFDPTRSVCEWGAIQTPPSWTVLLTPAAHPVMPDDGANCDAHARRFWDARGRIEIERHERRAVRS